MRKKYTYLFLILLISMLTMCLLCGCGKAEKHQTVTVYISSGYRIEGIINTFTESGVGTREGFIDALTNVDYSGDYWFIKELDEAISTQDEARIYNLEGYLYPDVYTVDKDASEQSIIRMMLDRFNEEYDQTIIDRATELGYTTDEVVTLASVVERESYPSDYALVSSVFHNRLDIDMKLQSNVTVSYTMSDEDRSANMTIDLINKYDNGYNTYLYKGLPLGAICSPSREAIVATLYPADTDYLFFVSDSNGKTYYAETYEEHKENVALAHSVNAEQEDTE